MPSSIPTNALSDQELTLKMAELLAKWPLYRKLRFKNESVHDYPEAIRAYCPICHGERNFDQFLWEGMKSTRRVQGPWGPEQAVTARRAFRTLHYRCPDCKRHSISYFVSWEQASEGQENVISKCGQSPAQEIRIDPILAKRLGKLDSEFLERGQRCRMFSFGLAAVSYLRRVVEDQMNALLDILKEEKPSGWTDKKLEDFEAAKTSWQFSRKLEYAAELLPPYLRRGGDNPLARLHDLASDGLHNKTEEECIEIFDMCVTVLTYVFRELELHRSDAEEYKAAIRLLNRPIT